MVRRLWIAAALATIAGFGCHASPTPNAAKTEPPLTASDVTATKFIAAHNENARLVTSLRAAPKFVLLGEHSEREARASGHLAFERSKNFRLVLEDPFRRDVADIGSNEQGFWFWVKDDKQPAIYVCDHKDVASCQLAVSLQPDWIVEAMGLREFSEREAQVINARPGDKPGLLVLTQSRRDAKGQSYTKETVITEATGRIVEHRLYAGNKKELLASATVTNYTRTLLAAKPTGEAAEDGTQPQAAVYLPDTFRLNWVKENLAIEVSMPRPEVNPAIAQKTKLALFKEPPIPGTTRRNLAQLDLDTVPASARVRETRPMPPAGVRLLNPRPAAGDPLPLTPDLRATPAQPTGVVGALIPSGGDSGSATTGARFRSPTLNH